MDWKEEITQRYLKHKSFGEEVSDLLKHLLDELQEQGVPTKCNLSSHYPLEWSVTIGMNNFTVKGNDIYKSKEVYDGNGFIHNHNKDTKEVLQELLVEQYTRTF
ncbi:hypothetical protein ACE3MZ_13835 [Paenibacillus sp. WLX1005]|uniref:hypothetical protein n=1 Tax=Paenibacillus sp. WLX1005 TaxID=3243766 RepID=UPI003983F5C3